MIYLAVPYTDKSATVRHERFEEVSMYAAYLMQKSIPVFSPISHSHPIEQHFFEAKSWDFWQIQDLPILKICNELHVLCLSGWSYSVGVRAEIEHARELNLPVKYINPRTYSEATLEEVAKQCSLKEL
jgi:hypothetical protein